MTLELIFLGAAMDAIDREELEPLCRIKLTGGSSGEEAPFVAFTSLELGRKYIECFPKPSDFSLLSLEWLKPEQIARKHELRTVLFENTDQIDEYNKYRQHFNFSAHLVSVAEAMRKVSNAL